MFCLLFYGSVAQLSEINALYLLFIQNNTKN